MERILTAFALAFGISLVWADSFNASLYSCVKGYCLPKNYNKLDIPNGSTKVYFQLPRIHPVVLREVNDVKRKLTLDMIFNMVWNISIYFCPFCNLLCKILRHRNFIYLFV